MAAAGLNFIVQHNYGHPESDRLEAIELCLEHGADINATNLEGFTAMHAAANIGFLAGIELLAGNGSKLNVKDAEGRTPMTFAHGVFLATYPPQEKPETVALLTKLMTEAGIEPESE